MGGWGGVGDSIDLIFSPTYTDMYFYLPNGRLCEEAQEISGISTPICLCGLVAGGFVGFVGVCVVVRL